MVAAQREARSLRTVFQILVVDDFEPFRQFIRSSLRQRAELQIAEASDGLEALQKIEQLQPDLILLDLNLPNLSGLEVCTGACRFAPAAKILFLSQDYSSDVAQEALRSGGLGYVYKLRVYSELLPAIEAVLRGNRFVDGSRKDHEFDEGASTKPQLRHEVQYYSDDAVFLESFAHFISASLKDGKAAIVVFNESQRHGLLQRLKAEGLNVAGAIESGTLVPLDNAETLSTFMVNGVLDPARLFETVGGVIQRTAESATRDQKRRVALCGECAPLLWAEGKVDAAIRLEQLWNGVVWDERAAVGPHAGRQHQGVERLLRRPLADGGRRQRLQVLHCFIGHCYAKPAA